MDRIKNNKEIIIAPIIVILVMSAAYLLGICSLSTGERYFSNYAFIHDVLHNNASPFFNFNTACGTGMAGAYVFSPLNLFLLFVKRNSLFEGLICFYIFKLALSSAAAAFFMKKVFKKSAFFNIKAALMYTAAAFIIQKITTIYITDAFVFLPLVLYGYKKITEGKSGILFTVFLLVSFVSAPLPTAVVWLYLIPIIFAFTVKKNKKETLKKTAASVTMQTLAAVLMSMFVIAPAVFDWYEDLPENADTVKEAAAHVKNFFTVKEKSVGLQAARQCVYVKRNGFISKDPSRIKAIGDGLHEIYGSIMGLPSLCDDAGTASSGYKFFMEKFGYNPKCMEGGTAFTDAFLGVGETVSKQKLNSALYNEECWIDGEYGVYSSVYKFPVGAFAGFNLLYTSFPAKGIKMQNLMYNALTGTMDQIIKSCDEYRGKTLDLAGQKLVSYIMPVKEKSTLYFYNEDPKNGYFLYLNGSPVRNDFKSCMDYLSDGKSGFTELGTYENETVTLTIRCKTGTEDLFEVGLLDNSMLEDVIKDYETKCASSISVSKNSISISAEPENECLMFLPIEYSNDWKATVNGSEVDVFPVMDNAFMAVYLPGGACEVKMKYVPRSFMAGMAAALVGLMFAVWIEIRKRENLDWSDFKAVQYLCGFVCVCSCAASIIFMYMIPLIYLIKH